MQPGASEDFRHRAQALGRIKTARVAVPPGDEWGGPMRTVYLLHAFGGNRESWLRHLDIATLGVGAGVLFVFPESGRRWFINDAEDNRYEDYLLGDLAPAIDAAFNTDSRPGARLVGGFSMGGAAAIYLALRHPRVFGAAFSYAGAFYASRRTGDPYAADRASGCMMPTEADHDRVWGPPGSHVRAIYDPEPIIQQAALDRAVPRMALAVGMTDHPRVIEQNRRMHATLTEGGLPHQYCERPGEHRWSDAAASARDWLVELFGAPVPGAPEAVGTSELPGLATPPSPAAVPHGSPASLPEGP